jgi:hypothetical protein
VTLFERIIKDTRFQAVVRLLDTQYRMNRRISDWASDNMYHGAIVSHPSVAEHTLKDILGGGGGKSVGAITDLGGAEGSGSDEDDALSETLSALDAATLDAGLGIPLSAENAEDVYPVLLLVDTSGLGMLEDSATATISSNSSSNTGKDKKSSGGSSHRNFHEAELVKEHVLSLVRSGQLLLFM